jgi:hypothetical protein
MNININVHITFQPATEIIVEHPALKEAKHKAKLAALKSAEAKFELAKVKLERAIARIAKAREDATIIRLPATHVTTKPRDETGFEYIQHRQRMFEKIKRLFGQDAAIHYLAGTV